MNLDEMKNSWNVLNERLEQNEILNRVHSYFWKL